MPAIIHLLISFLLLTICASIPSNYAHKRPHFISSKLQNTSFYKDTMIRNLNFSIVFGENKLLPKKVNNIYGKLGLSHLFSPSGLHLQSISIFIRPILAKSNYLNCILLILLCFIPFAGFSALKRCLLYKISAPMIHNKLIVFYGIFVFDFLFGSFFQSPISFILSFMFWGIFIYQTNLGQRIFLIIFAQIIVFTFFNLPINILSLISSIFLSTFFSIIFPVNLIAAACNFHWVVKLDEFLLTKLHTLVQFIYEISQYCFEVNLNTSSIILLFIILFYYYNIFNRKLLLILFLIFPSQFSPNYINHLDQKILKLRSIKIKSHTLSVAFYKRNI